MRIILIASFALLACVDAVVANSTPTLSVSAVGGHSDKRMLRADVADNEDVDGSGGDDDDEERILGLNHYKLWNMKRAANSEIKAAEKAKAKAAAKLQKEADKKIQAAMKKSAQEEVKAAKAELNDKKLAAQFIGKKWSPERMENFLKAEKYGDNQKITKFMETYKSMHAKAKGKDTAAAAPAAAAAAPAAAVPAAAAAAPAAAAAVPAAAGAAPAAAAAAPAAAAAAPAAAAAAPAAAAAAPAAAAAAPAAAAAAPAAAAGGTRSWSLWPWN